MSKRAGIKIELSPVKQLIVGVGLLASTAVFEITVDGKKVPFVLARFPNRRFRLMSDHLEDLGLEDTSSGTPMHAARVLLGRHETSVASAE